MNKRTRITILLVLGLIAIFIVAGGVWGAPLMAQSAQSTSNGQNPITTFLNDILHPIAPASLVANSTSTSASVPLYQPTNDYENAVVAAVKRASPAVVSITISENVPIIENCPSDLFGNVPPEFQQFFGGNNAPSAQCNTGQTQLQQVGGGSGFIISSDGLILTNKHVVSETGASYSVLTNDGKTYSAQVLARDPNQDLAVLKINATGLPTVSLGDSDSLQLGQSAIAIGNALGQFSNTVSVGVVSGLERTVTATAPDTGAEETIQGVIQTDAAINPGNSGGPLLNLRGEVIGIDTAVASDAQNIGFAIPINQAKSAINSVETTGSIKAPYLGVRYEAVTPTLASQQNLPVTTGALVTGASGEAAVEANSPAAAAGIKSGDIIMSIDGQQLDATHDLANIVNEHSVGDTLTLVVNRGGKEMTLQATLAERPAGQ